MTRDLSCPLTKSCPTYQTYLFNTNKNNQNIICKPVDKYFCMALYKINQEKGADINECALIQLLNNSEALLNLNSKKD